MGASHRKSMRQHSQAKQSTRDTRKMNAAPVIFPGPVGSAGLKPGGLEDLRVSYMNVSLIFVNKIAKLAQAHFAAKPSRLQNPPCPQASARELKTVLEFGTVRFPMRPWCVDADVGVPSSRLSLIGSIAARGQRGCFVWQTRSTYVRHTLGNAAKKVTLIRKDLPYDSVILCACVAGVARSTHAT